MICLFCGHIFKGEGVTKDRKVRLFCEVCKRDRVLIEEEDDRLIFLDRYAPPDSDGWPYE